MENFRSQSCRNGGKMDMRSYSTSYGMSPQPQPTQAQENQDGNEAKIKKSFGSTKSWVFGDPELQRKTRVASYKGYTLEKKVKGSFRRSFRWVKDGCIQVVHAWK